MNEMRKINLTAKNSTFCGMLCDLAQFAAIARMARFHARVA
ncbi:hypothetical protein [Variovorax sp. J31P207]|nr:hypothetical protein [Variovorax sp. J31P207]MDM0065324.1 hypothetical protein [Variovorax sp. J31P207]